MHAARSFTNHLPFASDSAVAGCVQRRIADLVAALQPAAPAAAAAATPRKSSKAKSKGEHAVSESESAAATMQRLRGELPLLWLTVRVTRLLDLDVRALGEHLRTAIACLGAAPCTSDGAHIAPCA